MANNSKKDNKKEPVAKAKMGNALQSPQKLRLVADLVRGKSTEEASNVLRFTRKKGANIIMKLLKSAMANAEHNHNMDPKNLVVSKILVNEGMKLPRYEFAARGRVNRLVKRRSKILIELSQE